MSGVVVGHPFDTIKVYIQTNKEKGNAIKVCKNIIQNESVSIINLNIKKGIINIKIIFR